MTEFWVEGTPRPQGSKKAFNRGGRIVLVEASKGLPLWRQTIIDATSTVNASHDGPIRIELQFFLERPKSVIRALPSVAPDVDKLIRAVFDALTISKIIKDDSLVCEVLASKAYSETPGVLIRITDLHYET